jgi:hypothetical protein
MDAITGSTVANASAADPATVAGAASLIVLKQALNLQAGAAIQLIQAIPQPALAASGALGTQVNAYA